MINLRKQWVFGVKTPLWFYFEVSPRAVSLLLLLRGWRAAGASSLLLLFRRRRQGGVCFERGPERADSTGKMATAGSAERPGRPASAVAGRSRSGSGPGARCGSGSESSPPEDEVTKCAACVETQPGGGGGSPCGHPACPLCLARRHPGNKERVRRRSDPESSSGSRAGRRDCDSQRGRCVYCTNYSSHSANLIAYQHRRWLFVKLMRRWKNIETSRVFTASRMNFFFFFFYHKFSLNRRRPEELTPIQLTLENIWA